MKILVISIESINVEDGSKVNYALVNNLVKAGYKVKAYIIFPKMF
jgi:hypothetical protein